MIAAAHYLLPIPILLPLVSAGFVLFLARDPRLQRMIALLTLATTTATAFALAVAADAGPVVLDVGSWAAPIGVTLVADRLASIMLVVSQIVTLAVLVFSQAQNLATQGARSPVTIYYPTYLILSAGVANAFLTGDLFNLFVGFEILLAASFVLITLGGTRGRVRAGTVYVVVSLLSSSIFLAGIALTYAATGTVNIAQLSIRLREIDPGAALMIQAVLLVAFGIKAAVVPLQAWLPDSYPTAPAPVTAVFAGLMTKVGVYAMIRLQVFLFPGDSIAPVLGVIALLTMIIGILGAVAQDDVKRLLSFTLVSHIGYMVWGLSLVTEAGLAAAIYYAAHHILVQTTLFLVAGLIEKRTGTTSLARLSGLARKAPLVAILFFITGMNLVGVPPLTGFVGKLGLAQASVNAAQISSGVPALQAWLLFAGGIVTSFLTLYVVAKWWNMAFWQNPKDAPSVVAEPMLGPDVSEAVRERATRQVERARSALAPVAERSRFSAQASRTESEKVIVERTPVLMTVTVAALVAVQVAMAAASGPIWTYVSSAARDQMFRYPYITAVLGEDGRGSGSSLDEVPDAPLPEPEQDHRSQSDFGRSDGTPADKTPADKAPADKAPSGAAVSDGMLSGERR